MVNYNAEALEQLLDSGKLGFSKFRENPRTGGFNIYFKDTSGQGQGNCPDLVLQTFLRAPFDLSTGKRDEDGNRTVVDLSDPSQKAWNLELSLTESENPQLIRLLRKINDCYTGHIAKNVQEAFSRKFTEAQLGFMNKHILYPDQKVDGRYLIRLKVNRSTQVFVALEFDEDGNVTKYRKGSLADHFPHAGVQVKIRINNGWGSPKEFGTVLAAQQLLIADNQRQQSTKQSETEEEFAFGTASEVSTAEIPGEEGEGGGGAAAETPPATATTKEAYSSPQKRSRTRTRKNTKRGKKGAEEDTGELSDLE